MSSFRTPYSTPTEEQAALVGHIVMDWALADFYLRSLATRLAFTPTLAGRAMTEEMSSYAALSRVDRLLSLHKVRYRDQIIPYENRLAIKAAVQQVRSARKSRNVFAHQISLRRDDDALDFFDLGSAILENDDPGKTLQTDDLRRIAREVRAANQELEAAISLIPEQSERSMAMAMEAASKPQV